MLDYITVKGFRSIKSIEKLELGPLTVLIGANGSGKSNFVGVFSFLNALREGRLKEYVLRAGGAENVLHYGSRVTEHLEIHISIGGGQAKYWIKLVPTGADELVLQSEFIDAEKDGRSPIKSAGSEAGIRRGIGWGAPMEAHVEALFEGRRIYHLHDTGDHSPMKKTADVHDNRYLRSDGSNLAAFLYLLRERHPDSYDAVVRVVRQAAPFFEYFQLAPENLNPHKIRLEWRHAASDAYFHASSLSDGTLRFMALATLFLQPEECRPAVILVDEPELGLHPYAIALLASLMKRASTGTQVVVSTQSSLLLDHFEPEDVIVAERAGGATTLERLDSPRLKTWLEDYSLGQLWEKNELGGPARTRVNGMSRLLVHVEGQTEEQFVQQVLAPYLVGRGYSSVSPRMVGNTRQRHGRGGIKNWMSVRKEFLKHLTEDRASIATTMVDYYGLPYTWPGRKQGNALKAVEQKASAVEKAILKDISSGLGGLDSRRFVPYVVMHEFEGLLFSDPIQLALAIGRADLSSRFQTIRDGFGTPEEIDDSTETAPSKRIEGLHKRYRKVLDGNAAIKRVRLQTICKGCPLFRNWIRRLEGHGLFGVLQLTTRRTAGFGTPSPNWTRSMQRNFVSFLDWSAEQLMGVLEAAASFRQRWKARNSPPALRGKRIALILDASGFRNRVAFELGIAELGGVSVEVPGRLDERERIEDVARYLDNWFDAIVARTATHEHMLRLAQSAQVPVVNARTSFNHPCEILGDLSYVREQRGTLDGLRVAFIGEATNLGHSWFEAAARFPIDVVQVCPEGYGVKEEFLRKIAQEAEGEVAVSQDLLSAVADADVIYTDCWPARVTDEDHQRVSDLFLPYQVTERVLKASSRKAMFLPCPPVHRGEEVSESAMTSPVCRVYEAKEYLLHAQNALLATLLNGRK